MAPKKTIISPKLKKATKVVKKAKIVKKAKKATPKEFGLYLRVLGYMKTNYTWAAHCLETDLVGYGRTFDSALNDLIELTEMQIGFAYFKNQPSLLDCPASADIIEIYNNLVRSSLHYPSKPNMADPKRRATSIPLPQKPAFGGFAVAAS